MAATTTATKTESAPVIKIGGGMGSAGAIALAALAVGGYFVYQNWSKDQKKSEFEKYASTPEGQIAQQLKNVFDEWPVDDDKFRNVWLQVNSGNKARIAELYYLATNRRLTDDIASHIDPDNAAKATKIEKYNSKPGKLFSIGADGKVKFEIRAGDKIRFTPGQTTPITVFQHYNGIILKELATLPGGPEAIDKLRKDPKTAVSTYTTALKPTALLYPVMEVREVPYKGIQEAQGWTSYLRPFVNVSKTFAMVRIQLGINPTTKKAVYMWIDARDMITAKTPVKGLEGHRAPREYNEAARKLI